MKKIFLLLLTIISCLSASSATLFTFGNIQYYVESEPADGLPGTVVVYKNNRATGDVVIADTVYNRSRQYIVTKIDDYAFERSSITSINLPNTLKYIHSHAFQNCSKLTSMIIPDSVIRISSFAFFECTNLTSVQIGKSVKTIGSSAFERCSRLTSINIPDSITSIGSRAFYGTDLISLEIGKSVKTIGSSAFERCGRLTSINIPDSVTSIGSRAFCVTGLISLEIGKSVKTIGSSAFEGCGRLTSINIPDSVTSIGPRAFYDTGLTSLKIGKSVESIGANVISGCSNLKEFIIDEDNPYLVCADDIVYSKDMSAVRLCLPWKDGAVVIPNTVVSIDPNVFGGCDKVTSITLPESFATIGQNAFSGCGGLMSISIPNTVTSIGGNAFSGCVSLTSISIPNTITEISDSTFFGCRSLVSISLPESVTSIGGNAFSGCVSLTSISLPESVKTIGENAFSGCVSLTSITIPKTVDTIENGAFESCSGLKELIIEDGETPLVLEGDYIPFSHCPLQKLHYGRNLETKHWPFKDNETLESLSIGNNIKSIADNAFSGCENLVSVNIGKSVETIGKSAFNECINLTSIVIPDSVRTIGETAFYYCSALVSVSLGKSVETIGDKAFYCPGWSYNGIIYGDSQIKKVKVLNPVPPVMMGASVWNSTTYSDAVLEIPEGTILDYIATKWDNFKSINAGGFDMPHSNIDDGIFRYRLIDDDPEKPTAILVGVLSGSITSATIPERVTDMSDPGNPRRYYVKAIGPSAFNGCSELKELSINTRASIEIICSGAFENCKALESFEIPSTVQRIEAKTFYGTCLRSVSIPATIMIIGDEAFANCKSMTEFRLEDSTEPISLGKDILGTYDYYSKSDTRAHVRTMYMGRDWDGDITADIACLKTLVIGNLVKTIPDDAFYGCSNLEKLTLGSGIDSIGNYAFGYIYSQQEQSEVVIPSSVRSIGDNAFTGNNLKSVIIGSGIETIGENAFAGNSSVEFVAITAQLPPTAPYTAFSNYNAKLYLQGGKNVIDAYYDAYTCWDRFTGYSMTVAQRIEGDSETSISGEPGDRIQLSAKVWPADVTLPQIFWHSTNPNVATVDNNGLVTIRGGIDEGGCRIIASTLYADGPVFEYRVNGLESGIDVPVADESVDGLTDVYSINGVRLGDSTDGLAPGIYIVRRGNSIRKVLVK